MKIVFFVNRSWNFLKFRKELLNFFANKHYDIYLLCSNDGTNIDEFREIGCKIIYLDIELKKNNIISELKNIHKVLKVYKRINPDFSFNFTIKPIVYGLIISRLLGVKSINTFTGLGYLYLKNKLIYNFFIFVLILILNKKNSNFILQNSEDYKIFSKFSILKKNSLKIINGSGVNSAFFKSLSFPSNINETRFIMLSRLLKEKGVIEFCEAARMLKQKKTGNKFILVGDFDYNNPGSLNKNNIQKYINDQSIIYLKPEENIIKFIENSHCVVLPSYREGLSKILLEAMSMSRPIITSNVPGCRHLIENNNGYLCEPKNILSLVQSMEMFINLSKESMKDMGVRSRQLIEMKYDIDIINNEYYAEFKKLI